MMTRGRFDYYDLCFHGGEWSGLCRFGDLSREESGLRRIPALWENKAETCKKRRTTAHSKTLRE